MPSGSIAPNPIGKPWAGPWLGLLACLLLSGLAWAAPTALSETTSESGVSGQGGFLFNFTQFVEWPTNTFAHATAPLVIGCWARTRSSLFG